MPLNLEKAVLDVVNSKSVVNIFNNPIYISLIIVFIVLLTIYLTFRVEVNELNDSLEDEKFPFISLLLKSGIYILLGTVAVVFVHNKNIQTEYENFYENNEDRDAINATIGSHENTDIKNILSGAFSDGDTKLNVL